MKTKLNIDSMLRGTYCDYRQDHSIDESIRLTVYAHNSTYTRVCEVLGFSPICTVCGQPHDRTQFYLHNFSVV